MKAQQAATSDSSHFILFFCACISLCQYQVSDMKWALSKICLGTKVICSSAPPFLSKTSCTCGGVTHIFGCLFTILLNESWQTNGILQWLTGLNLMLYLTAKNYSFSIISMTSLLAPARKRIQWMRCNNAIRQHTNLADQMSTSPNSR